MSRTIWLRAVLCSLRGATLYFSVNLAVGYAFHRYQIWVANDAIFNTGT